MKNLKKALVFGLALMMVLTVFAAIPTPMKATVYSIFGMLDNTDGSAGDASTANSMSQAWSWRDVAPDEIGHASADNGENNLYDADGSGTAAYDYTDYGDQWSTGVAAGQDVVSSYEVKNGVNGWTGGNQSGGNHQTITSADISNSETDYSITAQLNDLPDPYDDGSGNMAWDAMANDPAGVLTGYEIYESPDNSAGSYTPFYWVAASNGTTYPLSSLNANNYYKIGFSYLYGYNTSVMSDVPFHNVATAHTATATGPTNTAASNVADITITYTNDTGTTSVDLYYTTDGGSTWNSIGSDSSIDGSYAWTIPADGTYGWMAVADGESAPASGDAPEASSYTYDGTAPTVSSTTPADSATSVAVNANIVVVYSESMDTSVTPSLSDNLGTTYNFAGWSTTNVANDTATWTHADWALSTTVNPTVSDAKDVAGNTQTSYSWSFTTAGDSQAPAVTINSVVDPLEGGANQTIDATVDDSSNGGSTIAGATYTVIAPSGMVAVDNASMDASDGNFDSATESVTATYDTVGWAPGTYTVYVYGSDGSNIGSASTTYTEQDTSAPALDYVQPGDGGTVAADQDIVVLVDIADANQTSDIDTVTLYWTNDSGSTTNTVTMTYKDNGVNNTVKYVSGRWSGNIPAQADGTDVSYHIDASDAQGNSVTGPTYTVTASSSTHPQPYTVYGYVYLYNGSASGYNPLLCDGTAYNEADIAVSWVDSSTGDTITVTNNTDQYGRYEVDLYNYTDGGSITVNASDSTDSARYNLNYSTVNAANSGSMVNVTFGIPARLNFTAPNNLAQVSTGSGFNVQYTIYDDHGVIAPGYYGTVHITTDDTDPGVSLPADLTFDGVGGAVGDGQASPGQVTLITMGLHYLNITDTASDLTPPAIYPDAGQWWDNITVEVTGLQVTWDLSQPGWHICSMPVVPVASTDSASEITGLIYNTADGNGVTLGNIIIANRTGSNPSTYDTYIYGSGGPDFKIEVGMAYWVYVDQGVGGSGSVGIQGNNYTGGNTFTKSLFAGWNMIGIAHNYTGNTVVDFESNVNPGVAGAGAYITYSAGVPTNPYPGTAWYASYWNVGTQSYVTYVYQFNQPTDARNHAINIMNGATGFWLYVPGGGTMTYPVDN